MREEPAQPNEDHVDGDEPLICMRDNAAVPADNLQCPHPTSACQFRELCEIRAALRRKKRSDAD